MQFPKYYALEKANFWSIHGNLRKGILSPRRFCIIY